MRGREREYSKRWLKRFLDAHPSAWAYKIPDSPIMRKPFDCVACVGGKFWGIEFKMADNSLTAHQRDELLAVKAAGGVALVLYFGEIGEVVKEEFL